MASRTLNGPTQVFLRPIDRRPDLPSHIVARLGATRALCGVGIHPPAWFASKTTERKVCTVCWRLKDVGDS